MNNFAGIFFVLLFVMLSAVNGVYMSAFLMKIDVFVILSCVFFLIALFFNIFTYITRDRANHGFARDVRLYLGLSNITTAANWISFYFAIKHIEPAISATLINSILPLVTIFIAGKMLDKNKINLGELLTSLALLTAMLVTIWVVFSGKSGRAALNSTSYLIGISMSLFCGISMALNTVVAKKLNSLKVSPSTIMSHRFYLLILIAILNVDHATFIGGVANHYQIIVLFTIIGNLIPLFSLQLGIKRLNPVTVSFINTLGPITHFLIQILSGLYAFSAQTLSAILVTTIVIFAGVFYSSRQNGPVVPDPKSLVKAH